jgi:S1-C subfamily serine protease
MKPSAWGLALIGSALAWTPGLAAQTPTPEAQQGLQPPVAPAAPVKSEPSGAAPDGKGTSYRDFAFTHLVVKLNDGQVYANYRLGNLCLGNYTKTWNGGQTEQKVMPGTTQLVRDEMKAAGLKLAGDPDNIFEKASPETAETELGAIITDVRFNYCLRPQLGNYNANAGLISGSADMTIEWQIYDKLTKTVLGKVTTVGAFQTKTPQTGGENALFIGAFRDNVQKLAASQAFRTALATPESHDLAAKAAEHQESIPLPGSLAAGSRPLPDAVAAVVLIAAGQAEGSGFLVSSGGLVMTDQHVVGDALYVKVRWADGIEGLGEVIRTDKTRDVALVKTDARGRKPLALRRDPLQPGDAVFAIGAPMGDKYQNSVTRGIVSAYRTFDGLSYIQSDVNVNHGSSGGPLLDEKGQVVGLTEQGAQIAGAPLGLNLFTPVGDALAFLSAQPQ